MYILFENSYTFHNISLNLPPSKNHFALRANFSSNYYKCLTFRGEKTLLKSEVGRSEGGKLIPSTIPSLYLPQNIHPWSSQTLISRLGESIICCVFLLFFLEQVFINKMNGTKCKFSKTFNAQASLSKVTRRVDGSE